MVRVLRKLVFTRAVRRQRLARHQFSAYMFVIVVIACGHGGNGMKGVDRIKCWVGTWQGQMEDWMERPQRLVM